MNVSSTPSDIVLARGEILNLDGAEGARITSLGGAVWITQDGDLRDIVLNDGEAFELDRPTPAIVQSGSPRLDDSAQRVRAASESCIHR